MKRRSTDFLIGVIAVTVGIMSFFGEESVADKEPERVVSVMEYLDSREELADSVVELDGGISYITYTDTGVAVILDKRVNCYFRGDEANKTTSLKIGDSIRVKGISTMNSDGMPELNSCSMK